MCFCLLRDQKQLTSFLSFEPRQNAEYLNIIYTELHRKQFNIGRDGISIDGICEIYKSINMDTKVLRIDDLIEYLDHKSLGFFSCLQSFLSPFDKTKL